MKYLNKTQQGYSIIAFFKESGNLIAVFKKDVESLLPPYGWAWGYDVNTGSWSQGHYDYETLTDVLSSLRKYKYYNKVKELSHKEVKGL